MNINRNNYEEWLLMYVDNELTAADRTAVESFIQQNPDLQPELEMLQQAVLKPEPVSFNKNALYKTENAAISISNYEEYFLLYVDNELNAEERNAVETFVLQHPALQNEFTAFKETVLSPEHIVFTNKEILFRKESTKIIAFEWKRLSVAAAILGIIATAGWLYNSKEETGLVAETVPQQKNVSPAIQNNITIAPTENIIAGTTSTSIEKTSTSVANKSLRNTPVTNELNNRTTINTVIENDPTKAIAYQPVDVINKGNGTTEKINTGTIDGKGVTIDEPPIFDGSPTSEAVAYKELEEESTNDNIGIGPLSVNKDKLKGIFRKAGRFLTSKTKTENEDGKLQVANLEIDTRKLK